MAPSSELPGKTGGYVFDSGTSFAASQISGIICNTKFEHPCWSPKQIKDYLLQSGKKNIRRTGKSFSNSELRTVQHAVMRPSKIEEIVDNYFSPRKRFEWMDNIGVYPYSNKEMHALSHFIDFCPFQVREVFDYPKSVVENRIVKLGSIEFRKKWQVEQCCPLLDTFVFGYPYETPFETNHHFFYKLLDYLVSNGLNAFCFSEEIANEIRDVKRENGRLRRVWYMCQKLIAKMQSLSCHYNHWERQQSLYCQ